MPEETGGGAPVVLRERGTWKIVGLAIAVAVLWFAYTTVHVGLMQKVKWPPIKPDTGGLTVIGLQDKERAGYMPPYKAIESGRAWQIRRTEEGEAQQASKPDREADEETDESKDRGGTMPAGAGRASRGEAVPLHELLEKLPTVLTGKHFSGARVQMKIDPFLDRKYFLLHLGLTDEGRSRFWQYSREHDGERLAFIFQGHVMFCPRITHMDVSTLTIDPVWDEADADRMEKYLETQH